MKSLIAVCATLAVFAGNLQAGDPAEMIKQKAKDIANQNNAQQGLAPAYPSASQPAAPSAPAAPSLTPQQQAFVQVRTDLGAIKPEPTAQEKAQFANDLQSMAQGANRPSPATTKKLANDLSAALAGKTLSALQRSRMVTDIQAILNSATTPQSQLDDIIGDVPAILKKAGADANAAKAVGDDLKAAAGEIKRKPSQ